jgi:hypothetical protein
VASAQAAEAAAKGRKPEAEDHRQVERSADHPSARQRAASLTIGSTSCAGQSAEVAACAWPELLISA